MNLCSQVASVKATGDSSVKIGMDALCHHQNLLHCRLTSWGHTYGTKEPQKCNTDPEEMAVHMPFSKSPKYFEIQKKKIGQWITSHSQLIPSQRNFLESRGPGPVASILDGCQIQPQRDSEETKFNQLYPHISLESLWLSRQNQNCIIFLSQFIILSTVKGILLVHVEISSWVSDSKWSTWHLLKNSF